MKLSKKVPWWMLAVLAGLGAGTAAPLANAAPAASIVPRIIPLEGYLTALDGTPVDGEHDVTVSLFRVTSGGTAIIVDSHETVPFVGGNFVVYLGGGTSPVELADLANLAELWVEVNVDGDVLGPRFRVGSVPYAGVAQVCGDAGTLGGLAPDAFAVADHKHAWQQLTSVPTTFADGVDNDTLGGMSCTDGQVASVVDGKWACSNLTVTASDIKTGVLPTSVYSAYADLQAENQLGTSLDTNILTRGTADARYMSASVSVAYNSVSATNGATNTKQVTGRFCALSSVQTPGAAASCAITGASSPFTLTAVSNTGQTTNCSAVCF